MNRLFGRGKPKEPPPNLTDCIANVSFSNKENTHHEKKDYLMNVEILILG